MSNRPTWVLRFPPPHSALHVGVRLSAASVNAPRIRCPNDSSKNGIAFVHPFFIGLNNESLLRFGVLDTRLQKAKRATATVVGEMPSTRVQRFTVNPAKLSVKRMPVGLPIQSPRWGLAL